MTTPAPLASRQILFLATGVAGSFLIGLSAQLTSAAMPDVGGGVYATADQASWIVTAYTMASFAGIVTSGIFIRALGIGRYLVVSATVFGTAALACATAPELAVMIALRTVQGFVAGGFGPAAFVAVFMVAGGPRLPFGMMLLASAMVLPLTIGPVVTGFVTEAFGWQALFLIQAVIGAAIAAAAGAWVPHPPADRSVLKADWVAIGLLAVALATSSLVISQGTRRFWFESDMITLCAAVSIGAWAGFAFLVRYSPLPLIRPGLFLTRWFGIVIGLNLVFRVSLAVTAYLVPQFLAIVQGFRPHETGMLMTWAAVAQFLAFPAVWWLMHWLDLRAVMASGLLICAAGIFLAIQTTGQFSGDQFLLTLVLFSTGQVLFLVPSLVIGTGPLKPADLPTASLVFNVVSLGGSAMGIGLLSNFVVEGEKAHSNAITENVSLYSPLVTERITAVASALSSRLSDDAAATTQAVRLLGAAARRQAWALSFGDALLLIAVVLAVSTIAILALERAVPLRRSRKTI